MEKDISLTHHYQFKTVMLATPPKEEIKVFMSSMATAAAAKSLQSCPTLCNPIDGSPPGSTIPGILQARTLEWVAISFSNAWKWKVKVKSFSRVRLFATPWTEAYQAPPWDFPGKSTRVGCHCLLPRQCMVLTKKQKYKPMEQDRKPRDKPTHLWAPYLWQRRQEYTMEKR